MDQYSDINDLIRDKRIRQTQYQNMTYFSLIDVFAVLLNSDKKQAQNYYHVFKRRLSDNGNELPFIIKLKAQSSDMKFYRTDFTNAEGIDSIYSQLEGNLNRRKTRIQYRQDDEVENFHPLVIALLEEQGWQTKHHIRLQSGHVIDIVATRDDISCVVECKPQLTNMKLYTAIGQVLCYQAEYDSKAVPTLATYSSQVGNYETNCCKSAKIELIAI